MSSLSGIRLRDRSCCQENSATSRTPATASLARGRGARSGTMILPLIPARKKSRTNLTLTPPCGLCFTITATRVGDASGQSATTSPQ
eukprot:4450290-Amphidinium_carterae.1